MVKKNDFYVCVPIQDVVNASKLISAEELGYLLLKVCGQDAALSDIGNVFYESISSFQEKQHQKYVSQQKINIERHNRAEAKKEKQRKQKTPDESSMSSFRNEIKYDKKY